jgi:hypothetical protein
MEAEMEFHACIARPMSFDWHGSTSPKSGLDFVRAYIPERAVGVKVRSRSRSAKRIDHF